MKKWPLIVFAASCLVALLIFAAISQAAQVTLQWDANNPSPGGYRLYQRTEGANYNYAAPVWTGQATMATVTGLADNTRYYYVVRAYTGTNQSGDSNEVLFVSATPTPIPTQAPTPTPTPPPTPPPPECFPIFGAGGFIDTLYTGTFSIYDDGKLWVVTVSEPAPEIEYSGNVITGTFHKTGCRYFGCLTCTLRFANREEAVSQRFKPCGICKP